MGLDALHALVVLTHGYSSLGPTGACVQASKEPHPSELLKWTLCWAVKVLCVLWALVPPKL
jgi:hypothetical protein